MQALIAALWLALTCLPQASAQNLDMDPDPEQAAQRLEHIRRELGTIASERRQLESRRGAAAQQVRRADEQVSAAARALHQTQAQLRKEQAEFDALRLRRRSGDSRLDELRTELARLVRQRYTRGDHDALKQLLSREYARQHMRGAAYEHYLHHYLQQRINALQGELSELEQLENEIAERRRTLETTLGEQQQKTGELERERLSRARTQAVVESQYASHAARERALGQDVRALEQLLARLRDAADGTAPGTAPPVPFQPGELLWPVHGRLVHRYGQHLPDGRRSSGLLIDAPVGIQVHAVADGTVVFSEWMTGYGMLLIIDHGHGKMSLYAHNESLLKQVGDQARRGEAIASIGHSGGKDTSGLYFELRQDGQPVNPETWLQRP